MGIIAKAKDYLGLVVAVVAVASIIIGGLQYFAKASDLKLVQLRLDQKIVFDQVLDTQKRIWMLEERNRQYGESCINWPDERDRIDYKELLDRYDRLKERERVLEKK